MKFSAYFALDAYSTKAKLMGRQKNGENLIKAFTRHAMSASASAMVYSSERLPEICWTGIDLKPSEDLKSLLIGAGFRGALRWNSVSKAESARRLGTVYYPAPPTHELASLRNYLSPNAFSIMGVTHTLSSTGAMDQLCSLALPPFQDWDALICTSAAAQVLAREFIEKTKARFAETTGASRFPEVQLPVIPHGVHTDEFDSSSISRPVARAHFNLSEQDLVFLFVGRLTFHAKANPAPMYQALQRLAQRQPEISIVCLESGQFPNQGIEKAFIDARQRLAPNVRFESVNGADADSYRHGWRAADVFVSLSDNIQETFGLTPVEAMAAGLPVIVSDWNGYKDTVIEGVTGFRVKTLLPHPGIEAGKDLAWRHAMQLDSYDYYIGRISQATVVDPESLDHALSTLTNQPNLRKEMGRAGRSHVLSNLDWSVIVPRYDELALELAARRTHSRAKKKYVTASLPWTNRPDPFRSFAHFSSDSVDQSWRIEWSAGCEIQWQQWQGLAVVHYGLHPHLGDDSMMWALIEPINRPSEVWQWLDRWPEEQKASAMRILMLAAKLNLCRLTKSQ